MTPWVLHSTAEPMIKEVKMKHEYEVMYGLENAYPEEDTIELTDAELNKVGVAYYLHRCSLERDTCPWPFSKYLRVLIELKECEK